MVRVRRNVGDLDGSWAEPVLWYARGVAAMKHRALKDPTSWRFFAAMHGFEPHLWGSVGHLKASDRRPSASVTKKYWQQCQHGSWYFLPWHRGYLLAFEAIVQAAITELGGPADWAMPYWNYFKRGQSTLPTEFASDRWPDPGPNPLYEKQRYGPNNDSKVYVPVRLHQVNLNAMHDRNFTGVASGGSVGFGGADTGFSHAGHLFGGVEAQPHNIVHSYVGGEDPRSPYLPGLMSDPDTAGLDPIFWLHHANIDRLWQAWNHNAPGFRDPTSQPWLAGPTSVGQRAFVMPKPDGSAWTYRPKDVVDIAALGYAYDDLSPSGAAATSKSRSTASRDLAPASSQQGRDPVTSNEADRSGAAEQAATTGGDGAPARLIGANDQPVAVTGATSTAVRLTSGESHTLGLHPGAADAVRVGAESAAGPHGDADVAADTDNDRFFLNLENVRGQSDASVFDVYVGEAVGQDAEHPGQPVGTIAPFGMRKASDPLGESGGQGLTFVLDITDAVHTLHAEGSFDADTLTVRLVPTHSLPDRARVTVGRISFYRQSS